MRFGQFRIKHTQRLCANRVRGVGVVSEKRRNYKSIAFIGVELMPQGKLFVDASDR